MTFWSTVLAVAVAQLSLAVLAAIVKLIDKIVEKADA